MIPGSTRSAGVASWPSRIVEDYRSARRRGDDTALERFWNADPAADPGPEAMAALAILIKEDLRHRFARGERPAVAEYLERFPALARAHDRMISLVYEEYCLREDHGDRPDPDSFCRRYEPWRDSLVSQLRYHEAFSRMASAPRRPVQFPEPGDRFCRFRLCSELGRGGVARVYLARDDDLGGRKFALKLSPDHGAEPTIQGRLDHPHIVAVTHVEHEPATGLRGMCMPYWPGLPLNEVIQRLDPARTRPRSAEALWNSLGAPPEDDRETEDAGRPTWGDYPRRGSHAEAVAWVGLKLAEALAHAHSRGIIHRDIKPANILLTRRGGPLLLDFNLAHASRHVEQADAANRGGTLPYMAPEQLRAFLDPEGWDRVSPAADLYSLGLVLRELLIGEQPPLPTPGLPADLAVWELLDLRDRMPPPPLRSVSRAVPHALEAILARCLAPEPGDRYPDAEALADDLRRFLARRPLECARNASIRERAGNWAHRNRLLLRPAALCVVIAPLIYGGAVRLNPGKGHDELVHLANYEASKSRFDSAESYYRQALGRRPDSFQAYRGLAAVNTDRAGDPAAGFAAFVREYTPGAEPDPDALRLAEEAGSSYVAGARHYERAVALAEEAGLAPDKCAGLHHDHAIALSEWGSLLWWRAILEYLAGRETYAGPAEILCGEADKRCLLALAALKQADSELFEAEAEMDSSAREAVDVIRCRLYILSVQLYMRRGDIASLGENYRESVELFSIAKERVADIRRIYDRFDPNSRSYRALPDRSLLADLTRDLEARLRVDEPKHFGSVQGEADAD